MRKYTLFGYHNELQDFAVDFLKMKGHVIESIDSTDPRKYMSKNLLMMGDFNSELLVEILPKVRVVVYVGNSEEVKEILRNFAEEKDAGAIIKSNTIIGDVEVYKGDKKLIEIYSSLINSELELVNKFLVGDSGPKISRMARYLTQFLNNRNSSLFDHENISELRPLYNAFRSYRDKADDDSLKMTKEEFLTIFKKYNPNGN